MLLLSRIGIAAESCGSETRAGDNRQTLLVRSPAVGLNVVVGILVDAEDDAADHFGCDFVVIRELLDKAGAGVVERARPG